MKSQDLCTPALSPPSSLMLRIVKCLSSNNPWACKQRNLKATIITLQTTSFTSACKLTCITTEAWVAILLPCCAWCTLFSCFITSFTQNLYRLFKAELFRTSSMSSGWIIWQLLFKRSRMNINYLITCAETVVASVVPFVAGLTVIVRWLNGSLLMSIWNISWTKSSGAEPSNSICCASTSIAFLQSQRSSHDIETELRLD